MVALRERAPEGEQRCLALDSPDGREPHPKPSGTATVVSRQVLGGLHSEYEWAA